MARRQPNYRLVKIHRSYTVGEIADVLGRHKNTEREWINCGLPTIDQNRPTMIRGENLVAFLRARRAQRKQSCQIGQMYCFRCRSPRFHLPRLQLPDASLHRHGQTRRIFRKIGRYVSTSTATPRGD